MLHVLQDYVAIMEFLMKHWKIDSLEGLNSQAQKAQEDVQALLTKFKRLTDRQVTCLAHHRFVGISIHSRHQVPHVGICHATGTRMFDQGRLPLLFS